MAIYHHKRENLLLEATAYSRRILIALENVQFANARIAELFAGMRADGRWSLYFDESPVIQFDRSELLRRVYVDHAKLAAANSRLVELVRLESSGRVQHKLEPLDEERQNRLLSDLQGLLARTYQALKLSQSEPSQPGKSQPELSHSRLQLCRIVEVIPSGDQRIYGDLLHLLSRRQAEMRIALSL